MYNILPYDKASPTSIEQYAKNLVGKTFYRVLEEYHLSCQEDTTKDSFRLDERAATYRNNRFKGSFGNLLEEFYFLYPPNSISEPDFPEANTELKVAPYEITSKNNIRAGERLVITMIPNDRPVEGEFRNSHLFQKLQLILFVLYLRDRSLERLDYRIDYVYLFNFLSEKCEEDYQIILDDYRKIINKIKDGKAHELSEGDTVYLGACTKEHSKTVL